MDNTFDNFRAEIAHQRSEMIRLELAANLGIKPSAIQIWLKSEGGVGDKENAGTTITAPISIEGKAKLSFWMVNEAGERIGKKIRHTVRLGENDDTDEDEEETDFDTVEPADIRVGDHVEWHDDCGVHRWEVKSVSDWTGPKTGVILQSLHAPLYATQSVRLPLPGDPFILRPRS